MSFLDNINFGLKTSEDNNGCDLGTFTTTYILTATTIILYLYQVALAYSTIYQDGRTLRNILQSLFYIPINIVEVLRFLTRVCVVVFVFRRLINIFSLNREPMQPPLDTREPVFTNNDEDQQARAGYIIIDIPEPTERGRVIMGIPQG